MLCKSALGLHVIYMYLSTSAHNCYDKFHLRMCDIWGCPFEQSAESLLQGRSNVLCCLF